MNIGITHNHIYKLVCGSGAEKKGYYDSIVNPTADILTLLPFSLFCDYLVTILWILTLILVLSPVFILAISPH